MPDKNCLLVISALGKDRPGIVDRLTKAILDSGGNLVDSRMTVLGGEFAILLLVEGRWDALSKLENNIPSLQKKLELSLSLKRTEARSAATENIPYMVEVVSLDHTGIVHGLASFFSVRNINIEDLSTSCYPAPHTGTSMFALHMTVGIPANTHIATLREEFMEYCDSLNLDAVLEPQKH
ncbi:MAG: glycine cleavage system protein R [gamma proteobacterium symbiont of Bathyaustriella thionipta]|nr:glycine cleavage system protein R [gamma proteobacterium symbiont of Bathyaustriella thionipta]